MPGMFSLRVGAAVAAVALVAGSPAQAQFGGLMGAFGGGAKPKEATTSQGCPQGKKKSAGASILGSMAGSMASRAAGKFASFVPLPQFADLITNAIACKLDKEEQKQAADATVSVTRGDQKTGDVKVGSTAEWTSTTREDVKGKSTVIARNDVDPSGMQCITVSDVVIVSGEETTANKKMCKPKGSKRYSLLA